MFNFSYVCTYDLLSFIPSLSDAARTVRDEFGDIQRAGQDRRQCRLVAGRREAGRLVDGLQRRRTGST